MTIRALKYKSIFIEREGIPASNTLFGLGKIDFNQSDYKASDRRYFLLDWESDPINIGDFRKTLILPLIFAS